MCRWVGGRAGGWVHGVGVGRCRPLVPPDQQRLLAPPDHSKPSARLPACSPASLPACLLTCLSPCLPFALQSSPLEYLYEHLSMTDKALVDRGEVADGLEELGKWGPRFSKLQRCQCVCAVVTKLQCR